MSRKIKNGFVYHINIAIDDSDNLFFDFMVAITNSSPLEVHRFKKKDWEVNGIKELMLKFFNVKSWEEIALCKSIKIRIMFDDGILRAIGKFNEELWLEIYPWDLIQ